MTRISIIIPILNEAKTIGDLLEYLIQNSSPQNISEIIIVDGGSSDGSIECVSSFISNTKASKTNESLSGNQRKSVLDESPGLVLLQSAKGRAKQMNSGAQSATGDILYFLHADSFPPKQFDQYIIAEFQRGNSAGCFKMKFDHAHWWLVLAGWLTQFHWRACRGGDQSQFISKQLFKELGGFDEQFIIYEDNDLINKLYARNDFVVIQKWITTSARRYETQGIWKLQYHFWTIYIKKWLGASPEKLHQYYCKHIKVETLNKR